MNKIISSALKVFGIIVAALLLISSLLTSERSLKFLLNFNQDSDLDLVEHTIDIAIRTGELTDSSLIARRIGTNPRVVCASPTYFERHAAPRSPNDLPYHNCLTYFSELFPSIWRFRRPKETPIEIRAKGNFTTNNAESLRLATFAILLILCRKSKKAT